MPHWHHILDDPQLTEHEKIVALAIVRLNGDFLGPAPRNILAPMCKISERQVQRCKLSLKKIGALVERVVRSKSGYVQLYKVVERQGSLLGKKPGLSQSSAGSGFAARPPTTNSHPLSVSSKSKTKPNTAQNCARTPFLYLKENEKQAWEQRQAAKNQREIMTRLGIPRDRRHDKELRRKRENQEFDDRMAELRRQAEKILA
jgi:hypothetical protein